MAAHAIYDSIGRDYARHRRPDPRIAARLTAALGDARSVLNVGAGSGNYEPSDRHVIAVEPSYVDPAVRAGMSSFARPGMEAGLARLSADLASGVWHARNGHLLEQDALDLGYRLVVAHLPARAA